MQLTVKLREKFGKANRILRKTGIIPAELYGHGVANLHLAVNAKEFRSVFKTAGENTIVELVLDQEKRNALIHEVKRDYLSGEVEHVDFFAVRMDEKIKVHVPIEFVGEALAVKEKGGILNKTMSAIEVEALPANLPQRFTVDLTGLIDINQSIYVRDLTIPKNVTVQVASETVIVSITPPLKEEEVAPAPVDVTAVKVETEEKKAERDKDKATEEKTEAGV